MEKDGSTSVFSPQKPLASGFTKSQMNCHPQSVTPQPHHGVAGSGTVKCETKLDDCVHQSSEALPVECSSRKRRLTQTASGGHKTSISGHHQDNFRRAVLAGESRLLKQLLQEPNVPVDVNSFDSDGQTALHQSCVAGDLELVKVLVAFGADTRLATRDGWNPLHIATFCGHWEIATYLLNLPPCATL